MHIRYGFLKAKIILSAKTLWWLLRQWRYSLLAVFATIAFFELIYWFFNFGTLWTILSSGNLTLGYKIHFFFNPMRSLIDTHGAYTAILVLALSIIQGIAIMALTYAVRRQRTLELEAIGGGSIVGLLAIIGLGCPSCGTSLVTPIVAIFVSGSSAAIAESITRIALPIALVIGIYGLYVTGLKAANARALTGQ